MSAKNGQSRNTGPNIGHKTQNVDKERQTQ